MISKEVMLLAFLTMICYYSIKRRYIMLYVISLMTYAVRGPFALMAGIPIILRKKSGNLIGSKILCNFRTRYTLIICQIKKEN